jgi:citrate synthase
MYHTLFELTEDHLLEGSRSIPLGYVSTSHIDFDKGLMYFGEPVENFSDEPTDQLVERFLGQVPFYALNEETKILIDQIDRSLTPFEQLHQAIDILGSEEYKADFKEQVLSVVGSIKEIAEILFGPLPIDPLFYALHLDEGGGSPPAFIAKALASNGADGYKSIQGALLSFASAKIGHQMQNALIMLQNLDFEEMDEQILQMIESGQTIWGYDIYPFQKVDTRAQIFERALAERFMDEPLFQKAVLFKQKIQKVPHSHAFSGLYLFCRGFEEIRYYSVILFLARIIGVAAQLLDQNANKCLEIHPYYFYRKKQTEVEDDVG